MSRNLRSKRKKVIPDVVPEKFRGILKNIVNNNCIESQLEDKHEQEIVYQEIEYFVTEKFQEIQKKRPLNFVDIRKTIKEVKKKISDHIDFLIGSRYEIEMYLGN